MKRHLEETIRNDVKVAICRQSMLIMHAVSTVIMMCYKYVIILEICIPPSFDSIQHMARGEMSFEDFQDGMKIIVLMILLMTGALISK